MPVQGTEPSVANHYVYQFTLFCFGHGGYELDDGVRAFGFVVQKVKVP
jgi:hypothetical protein